MKIAVVIFLIFDIILYPLSKLFPLEYWVLIIVHIAPIILSQTWLGLTMFAFFLSIVSYILIQFNWYKGTASIHLGDETIYVAGKMSTLIRFRDLKDIYVYASNLKVNNTIRFDLGYDKVSLRFRNLTNLAIFMNALIPLIANNNIPVNNWD